MADRYEDQYRRDRGYRRDRDERGFIDRAGDEVRSWFGDDDAERRRQMDDRDRGYFRDRDSQVGGYGARPGAYESGRYGPSYESGGGGYAGSTDRGMYGYGDRGVGYGDRTPSYGYGDRSFSSGDRGRNYYGSDRSMGTGYDTRSGSGPGFSTGDRDERSQGAGWFSGRGPKGYQRSDARINEDVCDRLCDSPEIDATDVEVQVHQGEVTLTGCVSDRSQKRRAEDLIEQVSGVREVHNNLRVGNADLAAGSRASSTGAATQPTSSGTPDQPGNVLGVTGGVDKAAAAGRR
jgi:osmotically-inducible protein OsmY